MSIRFKELDEGHQRLVNVIVNTMASHRHLIGLEVIDEILEAAIVEIRKEGLAALSEPDWEAN